MGRVEKRRGRRGGGEGRGEKREGRGRGEKREGRGEGRGISVQNNGMYCELNSFEDNKTKHFQNRQHEISSACSEGSGK